MYSSFWVIFICLLIVAYLLKSHFRFFSANVILLWVCIFTIDTLSHLFETDVKLWFMLNCKCIFYTKQQWFSRLARVFYSYLETWEIETGIFWKQIMNSVIFLNFDCFWQIWFLHNMCYLNIKELSMCLPTHVEN